MFQPIENKIVVQVVQKHTQAISNILRLSALQNNSTIDPADFVTITGEVMALPKRIHGTGYEGFTTEDIHVGDIAIFSYQVVFDVLYRVETETVEYKNMAVYKGKEYFLADITNVFAVIRGGDIIMVNGYVMLSEYPAGIIVLQQSSKKVKGTTHSTVMHIGKPKSNATQIDVRGGDEVLFSPFKPQHYQVNGKPFIILRQNQILGRI
jgi:co-chaperonin GroES (HSP10)